MTSPTMTSVTMTKTSSTSPMFLLVIVLLTQTMIGFASAEPISTVLPSEVTLSMSMLMKMMMKMVPMMWMMMAMMVAKIHFQHSENTQEANSEGVLEDAVLEHMVSNLISS